MTAPHSVSGHSSSSNRLGLFYIDRAARPVPALDSSPPPTYVPWMAMGGGR